MDFLFNSRKFLQTLYKFLDSLNIFLVLFIEDLLCTLRTHFKGCFDVPIDIYDALFVEHISDLLGFVHGDRRNFHEEKLAVFDVS